LRVVLDRRGRLRPDSQLAQTARETPVLLVTGETASVAALRAAGIECLALPDVNVAALLDELGRRRFTNILVEGGSSLLGSFLDAGAIDEVHVFIAAKLAGGQDALSPVGGLGVERIAQALQLEDMRFEAVGGDLLVRGRIAHQPPP
jgi:diaminohydroxyphosphoribosylaminopyrimidine deaminase/5-amino-6-(5-phosphoribosylamino)uracil reductase